MSANSESVADSGLGSLRVVLVEPSHPGNIGAVARSMWTMGLTRLVLVRPKIFPSAEATARAAGADELLYRAHVCDELASAIEGCGYVTATTARKRRLEQPVLTPREWGTQAIERAAQVETALVFGRENSGLNNAELDLCHALAKIPANEAYASLNLASAVQLFAYEARQAWLAARSDKPMFGDDGKADRPATADELAGFYGHLERVLIQIGYLDPQSPKYLMRRLRRLYGRAQIEQPEVNILRGILAAAERAARGGRRE